VSLILKRASVSRRSGEWRDDDDDVLADGVVVGRIMKAAAVPAGVSWMWTLDFGHHGAEHAMRDRTLITTGIVGAVVAAVCCVTSLLAILFGALGLTAWLAKADYVLIPALILCLALVAFGLYRRRLHHG
jgi:mercuric ion transport protein